MITLLLSCKRKALKNGNFSNINLLGGTVFQDTDFLSLNLLQFLGVYHQSYIDLSLDIVK